jgi:hypothetical protein
MRTDPSILDHVAGTAADVDQLLGEALEAMVADLRSLLPAGTDEPLEPSLLVLPRATAPTGLGGYVGPHDEPSGDVHGRRVEARVEVDVRTSSADALAGATAAVSRALLTAARGDTDNGAVLRVTHADGPLPAPSETGRTLAFDVRYEYLRRPTEAGGVIADVVLDLDVGTTPFGRAVRAAAAPGVLSRFDVVDDPGAIHHTPSTWEFDPEGPAIVQRAETWGGSAGQGPNTPGTTLLLRATPVTPPAADLLLRSAVTTETGGVGLVWRWQGPDDFYFLLLDVDRGVRRIGRKVAGDFGELDEPAVDTTVAFPAGHHHLKVRVEGTAMRASLDGAPILAGADDAIGGPGRVGLLTRRNATARFAGLEYVPLRSG